MKETTIWRWGVLAVAASFSLALWHAITPAAEARRPAQSSGCCVAVIDLNRALELLDERKSRETELQNFIRERQSKLEERKRTLQQAQSDLRILPERGREWYTKRDEVVTIAAGLNAEEQAAKALIEEKRKLLSLELFTRIKESARRYAEREGIAVVISDDSLVEIPLDAPESQVQGAMVSRRLLYSAPGVDVTESVARMMNNEFKAK